MKGYRALVGTLAVTALTLAPACRKTEEGVKEDSRQNAKDAQQGAQDVKEDAKDAAHKVGEAAKEAGREVGETAKNAGREVGETAKEAGREIGASAKAGAKEVASEVEAKTQSVDVKAHLMADKSIDASHIDVDTDANTKTVILKGSVPTVAQKDAAEKLARERAHGYSVINRLTVREQ
jgi:osmotically-inducible protein OsmY